jgi:hypothetical protein
MSRAFVNENVRKRARQRARVMQAELDGRGLIEAPRSVGPPFIEPASLKAGFNTDGDSLVWFAIWNRDRNVATAIDASPDDLEPCERRALGDHYAGPFPSKQQAEVFASRGWRWSVRGSTRQFEMGIE